MSGDLQFVVTALDPADILVEHHLRQWAAEVRGGMTRLDARSMYADRTLGGRRISPAAQLTEAIVVEVGRESPQAHAILRAVYLGRGRWQEERRHLAQRLLGRSKLSRYKYRQMFADAIARVRAYFEFVWHNRAAL